MRKFIVRFTLYLILVFFVGLCFEYYITYKLENGYRYYFQGDWHDLKNHNSGVLFVGNSRTWVHCNPFIVQKRFNIKAEVLAQDGQSIHVLWLKFREYLKSNRTPKELYLQFDNHFLNDEKQLYGFKSYSTAFFGDRIDFTSLSNWNGYSDLFRFVPLLAIDPKTILKIVQNDTIAREENYESTHGFKSQNDEWRGEDWNLIHHTYFDAQNTSPYLDSFVNVAKVANIKLYALFTPQSPAAYKGIMNKGDFLKLIANYENKYNVKIQLLDYNDTIVYKDSTLFYNHIHLNSKGVDVFMKNFINDTLSFTSFKRN